MTAYDTWLEKPFQDNEAKAEAIQEIAEGLMENKYNPRDIDVFMQALFDGALDDSETQIADAIKLGNKGFEALGKAIWQAVHDYCEVNADAEAIRIFNQRK